MAHQITPQTTPLKSAEGKSVLTLFAWGFYDAWNNASRDLPNLWGGEKVHPNPIYQLGWKRGWAAYTPTGNSEDFCQHETSQAVLWGDI